MNEQQRQAYLDQINYGRIERVIAYKNVQFILEHQNDTLEQLSAYLQSCMEDIGPVSYTHLTLPTILRV